MTMEEMFDQNGYRTEEINGETRYVTRDEKGRAVVGPRQRQTRGLMGRLRGKKRFTATSNDTTVIVTTEGVTEVQGWKDRVRAKFYDADWHKAVQHTAIDVAMWAMCGSLAAVALKAAFWVVTL